MPQALRTIPHRDSFGPHNAILIDFAEISLFQGALLQQPNGGVLLHQSAPIWNNRRYKPEITSVKRIG